MVPAWIENKSASGACIRVKTPIGVGSKLSIQGRWDQISGVAKYCRTTGKKYLVGIQRDTSKNLVSDRAVPVSVLVWEGASDPLVSASRVEARPEQQENKSHQIPPADPKDENVPLVRVPSLALPMALHREGTETDWATPRIPRLQDEAAVRRTGVPRNLSPGEPVAAKERKPMQRKWSELIHRHNEKEKDEVTGSGNSNGKDEPEHRAPQAVFPTKGAAADPAGARVESSPVRLVRVEDIYRTAGIVSPRSGYSISKVVEMLHSEHTRELSKDAKRSAVLIALDAAGVPIDDVLQDAKARHDALDSYEAEQRREVDAEWQRKAEENVQIQAELECVKAHYAARVGRNLDGVAREKAAFNSWLTMKKQESQSITEAVDLCVKSTIPEPSGGSLPAVSMAAAGAKPV